jgi:CHAD domain-containing protein
MRAHLAALIREQSTMFVEALHRAREGHGGATHQVRVLSRRLREALPLAATAAPKAHASALIDTVRRAATALGGVRELNVALREFDEDASGFRWGTGAVLRVRDHLAAERDRRSSAMRTKLNRISVKRTLARAEALASAIEHAESHVWQTALAARVRKRARRFEAALRVAGTLYAPDALHRVRIAGKKLRYTLELAHGAVGAPVVRELASLKRLQELLGRLHDLQVLEEHVRQVAVQAADDAAMSAALERMLADLDDVCRRLHARFLAQSDRLNALAARAASDVAIWLTPRRTLRISRPRSNRSRPGGSAATA